MKQKGFVLVFILLCSVVGMFADYTVDFEAESKPSYLIGTVALNGIDWSLNNCLIGTLASDKKNGTKSARVKTGGDMTMLANKTGGLGTITLQYAKYGTDTVAPTLRVEYSTNDGTDWTQAGTDFDANAQASLAEWSAEVNVAGDVRIRILAVSGTSNKRANIDDIVMTDFASSTETITTMDVGFPPFIPGSTGDVTFFGAGTFPAGAIFTAQLSDENGDFSNPTDIGTYTLTAETTNPLQTFDITIPETAVGGTAYEVRVVCDNPAVIGSPYGPFTINGVSISPADDQHLIVGQMITPITGTIVGGPLDYGWYASEVSGGPYMETGIDGYVLSGTPGTAGTIYVVFGATFIGGLLYSNEVMIEVTEGPSVPYLEDFTIFPPAGWTNNGNWYSSNTSYAGSVAPEARIVYTSYAVGDELVSCPINTTGYSTLDVSWCQQVYSYSGGVGSYQLDVLTSTDGLEWSNTIWSYTYINDLNNDNMNPVVTIGAGDGVGSSTLYLKFRFTSMDDNRLSAWNIDDFVVMETLAQDDTQAVTTGDPMIDFDSPSTGLAIQFSGVTVEGNVTVRFYNHGPISTDTISDENVADYRWYIDQDNAFDFSGGEAWLVFYLDHIPNHGISDPNNVNVWHRESESEPFSMIDPANVTYDSDLNAIIVIVSEFSEFVFTSNEETLPVELSGFHGTYAAAGFVTLQWNTQSESGMLGYRVLRSETGDLGDAIQMNTNLIQANNLSEEQVYQYQDNDIEIVDEKSYSYWLEAIELNGTSKMFGPINVTINEEEEEEAPVYTTALDQNSPNPFNPSTTINFSIAEEGMVSVKIYNARGQLVKTLVNEVLPEGNYPLTWHGNDNNGNPCGSGVYFYKMETDNNKFIKKMLMLK